MSSADHPSFNSMNNSSKPPTVSINSASQTQSPKMLSGGWVTVKVEPATAQPAADNVTVTHFVNPNYDFSDLIQVPLIPILNGDADSNLGPIKQPTRRQALFSKIKQKCSSKFQKKAGTNRTAKATTPNPPPHPQANPVVVTPGMSSRSGIPLPSLKQLRAANKVSGFDHFPEAGIGTSNRLLHTSNNMVVAHSVPNVPSHLVANTTGGEKLGNNEIPDPSRTFIQISENTSIQRQQDQQYAQVHQLYFQNYVYSPVTPPEQNTVYSFGHGSAGTGTVVGTSNNFNFNMGVSVGNSNFAPQIQPRNYQNFNAPGPTRAAPQVIHHPPPKPKASVIIQERKVMVGERRLYYSAPQFIAPPPAPPPARIPAPPRVIIPEASNSLNCISQDENEWPVSWKTDFEDLMNSSYTHPTLEDLLKLDVSEFAPISKDLFHYYSAWNSILNREV